MRKALGTLVLGFAGGWLLSQMRAMPGGDLLDWPVASTCRAVGLRATALFLIGLVLWNRREGLRWSLLAAITFGYAATGLIAGPHRGIPFVGLVIATIAARIASGWMRPKEEPPSSQDGAQPANVGEMIGLFVAGGSLAIGLESIARHVRNFGSGLAQDDTVFGIAFLVFVTVGVAAFGWLASSTRARRLAFPVLLAASAAACFASLSFIETIADPQALGSFVKRWHVRTVDHGTFTFDFLVGSAAFVLPALLLGAALAGARGRRSIASATLGAATGLFVVPWFLERGFSAESSQASRFTSELVPLGVMAAVAGSALAILSESRRRPIARWAALVLTLPCALIAIVITVKPIFVLDPWSGRPILPYLVFDTPEGIAIVENSAGGLKAATLDRRRLTPETKESAADAQRLRDSFGLISATRVKDGDIHVLFIGQLSAFRANQMQSLGATLIDRSAPWWKAMPRLEDEMFKTADGSEGMAKPAGEVLSPTEARKRLAEGKYDLVIAPPVPGDAPAVARLDVPAKTVVARWIRLDEPLRGVDAREPAVLSADGLANPSLGVITHAGDPLQDPSERPRSINASEWDTYTPTPLSWLLVNELNRDDKACAIAFRSFAASWRPSATPFSEGLALHFAAQQPSSPYEHEAQRIELSDAALERFASDARGEIDGFTRRMWEWLARVLVGKRDPPRIEKYIGPVAAAHAPWTALEVALAYADLEGLDAPAAVARLEPVVAHDPSAWRAWFALGEAREITGDAVGAAAAFKHADDLAPTMSSVHRRFAMAACRAGDPSGRRMAQEILIANPKDTEMQAYVAPGPPPPAPTSYEPHD